MMIYGGKCFWLSIGSELLRKKLLFLILYPFLESNGVPIYLSKSKIEMFSTYCKHANISEVFIFFRKGFLMFSGENWKIGWICVNKHNFLTWLILICYFTCIIVLYYDLKVFKQHFVFTYWLTSQTNFTISW